MKFETRDLGRKSYTEVAELQKSLVDRIRTGAEISTLLLVEHEPVITTGPATKQEHLLLTESEYAARGITVSRSERGGDVTYHGPGQLVAYPVFDLCEVGKDLHRWLRLLEGVVIDCLSEFGIEGTRFPPHTGVWVDDRKICAIGIHVRKWVSMHGLALNCDVDMGPFSTIVPCGIQDYGVTSMTETLLRPVSCDEVKPSLEAAFHRAFGRL